MTAAGNGQEKPAESRDPAPKTVKKYDRVFRLLGLLVLLVPLLLAILIVAPGPLHDTRTVIIPHGTPVREIAALLGRDGVVFHSYLFSLGAKIIAYDSLQSGEYQFTPRQSIAETVLMMHEGKSVIHWFTVTEGMTSEETLRLLKNTTILTGEVATTPSEGSLLPETYRYNYGDSRTGLIARMQKSMQDMLDDLWAKRDKSIPLRTPQEAVVMASVIEKETGKGEERARIAGVFYNRLNQNMRLQSDPTVIYAILRERGPLNRELVHNDLAFPSPYNTYASDGLPPQPICNPGRAALEAALHPENHDYLYFVADGSGGHAFARSLAEHNQNVARARSRP